MFEGDMVDYIGLRKSIFRRLLDNVGHTPRSYFLEQAQKRKASQDEYEEIKSSPEEVILGLVASSPKFFELALAELLNVNVPERELTQKDLKSFIEAGFDLRKLYRKLLENVPASMKGAESDQLELLIKKGRNEDLAQYFVENAPEELKTKVKGMMSGMHLGLETITGMAQQFPEGLPQIKPEINSKKVADIRAGIEQLKQQYGPEYRNLIDRLIVESIKDLEEE
jgi:hypothetical protein